MKTMVLSFAHPDDDVFTCAMTVAKYVNNGWTVYLLCATDGREGKSGRLGHLTPERLGELRQAEARTSSDILGISSVEFLGYRDGSLDAVGPGDLEDVLFRRLVRLAPDIVITFDPTGISNHPDHARICLATTYAFQTYARQLIETRNFVREKGKASPRRYFVKKHAVALREERFADLVEKAGEPKLYYVCAPETVVRYAISTKIYPAEMFGKPWLGTPDRKVTTIIDGKRFTANKIKALHAHASQITDIERFLSVPENPLLQREYFILRMNGITEVFMGRNDRYGDRL
ncbi:hypothetical protein A2Z33_02450 [Candidatus Gottesmanbacteria bacterium RBG_16_52_11]|uniref:GlcNAc-PI de-N-acetylase n=1 Tax=Candidatus Gottesmanbacteria bacterium RBG_16_52_11 TaxID=1798374 RepID=A0A1F5YMW2_9BACT|nr:MAG: hypothetical protein A2Z33_02450 [Candidatus Gottesmanbacteria bacterium RBG_16_52_11]